MVKILRWPGVKFLFCKHYHGVANPVPCRLYKFVVREGETTIQALVRAKREGCVVEYKRKDELITIGLCSQKGYRGLENKKERRSYLKEPSPCIIR